MSLTKRHWKDCQKPSKTKSSASHPKRKPNTWRPKHMRPAHTIIHPLNSTTIRMAPNFTPHARSPSNTSTDQVRVGGRTDAQRGGAAYMLAAPPTK